MAGLQFATVLREPMRSPAAAAVSGPTTAARPVALLASGRTHGAVTRLITPWSIGELTTPFVFLDYAQAAPEQSLSGIQPHPRIATLTVVLNGAVTFEDASGGRGEIRAGGCGWMRAAHSAWRGGGSASGDPLRVFQLWIALPASQDDSPTSQGVGPQELEEHGPARVILGQSGRARSRIRQAPADINCVHVHLEDGQRWGYTAPAAHNVTWLAVDRGGVQLEDGARVYWEQIAVFGDSRGLIEVEAAGDTSFLLGSAARGPHLLARVERAVAAPFAAITRDDAELAPIGAQLRAQGRRSQS